MRPPRSKARSTLAIALVFPVTVTSWMIVPRVTLTGSVSFPPPRPVVKYHERPPTMIRAGTRMSGRLMADAIVEKTLAGYSEPPHRSRNAAHCKEPVLIAHRFNSCPRLPLFRSASILLRGRADEILAGNNHHERHDERVDDLRGKPVLGDRKHLGNERRDGLVPGKPGHEAECGQDVAERTFADFPRDIKTFLRELFGKRHGARMD